MPAVPRAEASLAATPYVVAAEGTDADGDDTVLGMPQKVAIAVGAASVIAALAIAYLYYRRHQHRKKANGETAVVSTTSASQDDLAKSTSGR